MNPYPKTIVDEASGEEVGNSLHRAYEQGRSEALKEVAESLESCYQHFAEDNWAFIQRLKQGMMP